MSQYVFKEISAGCYNVNIWVVKTYKISSHGGGLQSPARTLLIIMISVLVKKFTRAPYDHITPEVFSMSTFSAHYNANLNVNTTMS